MNRNTGVFPAVFCWMAMSASPLVDATLAGKSDDPPLAAAYHPEHVLVRFWVDVTPAEKQAAHDAAGAVAVLKEYRHVSGLTLVQVLPGNVRDAIDAYEASGVVVYAEPDGYLFPAEFPDDSYFDDLWGLHNTGQIVNGDPGTDDADIDAPEAWDLWTGDPDYKIAVIDTGVNYDHPDLAANIWTNPGEVPDNSLDDDGNGYIDDVHGYDFSDNNDSNPFDDVGECEYHGSHVAGTIGAAGNNGLGVAGVNWQCSIVALKVFGPGDCPAPAGFELSDALEAIEYIIDNDIKISNNSWGGYDYYQCLYDCIDASQSIGHLFVAAAGNGGEDQIGDDNDVTPYYPASYDLPNIIAVAATDNDDDIASFSNNGATSVDIGAPGVNILSTVQGDNYDYKDGTSMATPHVAGAVALFRSRFPWMPWQQVKQRLLDTVRNVADLEEVTVSGGIVNAYDFLQVDCGPQELAKLIASDAATTDSFGRSVAISVGRAIVGANLDNNSGGTDSGAAYVFDLSSGVWLEQAKLTASDGAPNDQFGYSVALDDDTAVLGAWFDDHAGGTDAGAVYVFVCSGGEWTQQAKLTAFDAGAADRFGVSVAVFGDTIVVGADRDDHAAGADAGSAYVFVRGQNGNDVWDNGAIDQQAKLSSSDAAAGDFFGSAVSVHADAVVVGANQDDHSAGVDAGSAYMFVRAQNGSDFWDNGSVDQQAKLTASDAATSDRFGFSVALYGDSTVIGAFLDNHDADADAGSAYVFFKPHNGNEVWDNGSVDQQVKLTASDADAGDQFGYSATISGDTVVVGSLRDDDAGESTGSAYAFMRSSGAWTELPPKLTAPDGAAGDEFGYSVALSGDTAVFGAIEDDHAGGNDAGSTYVFDLGVLGGTGDLDADGNVDSADATILVEVLLGSDNDPVHVARADINCSATTDGDDIGAFVTLLLE